MDLVGLFTLGGREKQAEHHCLDIGLHLDIRDGGSHWWHSSRSGEKIGTQ